MTYTLEQWKSDKAALNAALRWASGEFDIGNWSKVIGLNMGSVYFPTVGLEAIKKEFPDITYRRWHNTEQYRVRGLEDLEFL